MVLWGAALHLVLGLQRSVCFPFLSLHSFGSKVVGALYCVWAPAFSYLGLCEREIGTCLRDYPYVRV